MDKISRKDVKTSFYESARTIGGFFRLKFCKISIFFWSLSKNSVEQSREEASRRFVGIFCHQQRYTEEALLTFPKACGFEKQNVRKASRSFFRSLLPHSNTSFCLWDFLSVHAIVWQRMLLRALKLKWWPEKSRRNGVISKKRIVSMKQKTQSLSRVTFLLHETPTKNRLCFFKGVGEKSSKKTQTLSNRTSSCRRPVFHFPILLARHLRKMKRFIFGGGNRQHLNF